MGGAQPLACVMANAVILCVEVDEERIDKRIEVGYLQKKTKDLSEALQWIKEAQNKKESISVGLVGNAAEVYPAILDKGIVPHIVSDQTSAHDLVYGYVPKGYTLEDVKLARKNNQKQLEKRSEEHTSELQSRGHLVCRLLLEKKKKKH